jgi:hypothetical protein
LALTAQQMERYLVLPATDDPWVSLAAVGIRTGATRGGRPC